MRHKKNNDLEQLEFAFDAAVAPAAEPVRLPVVVSAPVAASRPAVESSRPAPSTGRPGLRVIQGGGARTYEKLASRDAVVRVLIEAGADLLLRRISSDRAEFIERSVNKVLDLFDKVDANAALMPVLQRHLDELESFMQDTRTGRGRPVAAGLRAER